MKVISYLFSHVEKNLVTKANNKKQIILQGQDEKHQILENNWKVSLRRP